MTSNHSIETSKSFIRFFINDCFSILRTSALYILLIIALFLVIKYRKIAARFIYFEAWYVAREETHLGKPKLSMVLLDYLLKILASLFSRISWNSKVVFLSPIFASTEHIFMHILNLKWYYDQKNNSFFPLDFKTMLTKQ